MPNADASTADAVLLDICAIIWVMQDAPLGHHARAAIEAATRTKGVHVCDVSAWELGMLVSRGLLDLQPTPLAWWTAFTARAGVRTVALTPDILIESSYLPGTPHGDPFDRIIMATGRRLGIPVVTRDRNILAYGEAGHLRVIGC